MLDKFLLPGSLTSKQAIKPQMLPLLNNRKETFGLFKSYHSLISVIPTNNLYLAVGMTETEDIYVCILNVLSDLG